MLRWLPILAIIWSGMALAKDIVLVSGFDPFGGASVNTSWTVAQQVEKKLEATRGDVDVVTCLLPTSYARAIPALEKCLNALPTKPVLVISLGAGPCNVKWETRVHNLDHDRGPDNDGVSRKKKVIIPGAPAEVGLRLNHGGMWCGLDAPAKKLSWISTSPENFVCNNTAFRFTYAHPDLLFGFIHVPGASCEKKNPGIVAQSSTVVSQMISTQLDVRATTTSTFDWPNEFNGTRLPTTKNEVKSILRGPLENCERELFSRWVGAF